MAGSLLSVGPILPSGWRWAEFSCGTLAAVRVAQSGGTTFEEWEQEMIFGAEMRRIIPDLKRWIRGGTPEYRRHVRRDWTVHERLAS